MKKLSFGTLFLLTILLSGMPLSAFAQSDPGLVCSGGVCAYAPLEPLPGITITTTSDQSLYSYINGVLLLLIIIGAMLAVARFSIGGIIFMTSDIAGKRSQAKSQMWACVWGLLLLISSVLILQTINPQLVQFNFQDLRTLAGLGQNCNPSDSACLQNKNGF
jgi:hypothetical protein